MIHAYPVVDLATGLVVNIIAWEEGVSDSWQPPEGYSLHQVEGPAIGDWWDGSEFVRPDDERHPHYVAPEGEGDP